MTDSPKRLCVVIVNYNTAQLTLNCIESLTGQIDCSKDRVVVVDNNSEETDIQHLKRGVEKAGLSTWVTIIASPVNGGFAAGNNLGIKAVQAEYYLLTNADTILRPKAIAELLRAASAHPRGGLFSPRLEWQDGEPQISCFRFHSPVSEFINSASTALLTRLLRTFDVPLPTIDEVSRPEWTSFACVLVRKEVFDNIGLLDQEYFMYFEDVEFCRRAKSSGYEIINWPAAHVVHLRGQSSGLKKKQREKKRLPAYYYLSRARYFTQFYGRMGFWGGNLCWLAGRPISWGKEVVLGRERAVPEAQHIDIWKN